MMGFCPSIPPYNFGNIFKKAFNQLRSTLLILIKGPKTEIIEKGCSVSFQTNLMCKYVNTMCIQMNAHHIHQNEPM